MASIKVKYRPSAVEDREGTIYYQIIHNRVARQIKTGYRMFCSEWESLFCSISSSNYAPGRDKYLHIICNKVEEDVSCLKRIIQILDRRGTDYSSDEVVQLFLSPSQDGASFFSFMRSVAAQMQRVGKIRISEIYAYTLNSFTRFRGGVDLSPESIDTDLINEYEAYLKAEGVCKNTSSFYMRNLRAVYNRAVDKGLTRQRDPFKSVYTGIDKTVKRAISIVEVKHIRQLNLEIHPALAFARDMFLFSFYTRGMSFIDMAYLKKSDLRNGILTYRRKKTGQMLTIRWEECMQEIVDKHNTDGSSYLLPIIKPGAGDECKQYRNVSHSINKRLKIIGEQTKLSAPLTMYVARHSWASIAHSKNIPLSVISEGLGHDSEKTTRIYLASLDTSAVDKANKLILKSL
ncbi:MAG: site-specific integrase [Parabacteroides sp.]|nr:site-specific integrase [Parabacteroides sp.]